MARFFIPPPGTTSNKPGEDVPAEFLNALEARLAPDDVVMVGFNTGGKIDREIDLAILTQHGIHVIEIKRHRGKVVTLANGPWYIEYQDGARTEMKENERGGVYESPLVQAKKNADALETKIRSLIRKSVSKIFPYVFLPFASQKSQIEQRGKYVHVALGLNNMLAQLEQREKQAAQGFNVGLSRDEMLRLPAALGLVETREIAGKFVAPRTDVNSLKTDSSFPVFAHPSTPAPVTTANKYKIWLALLSGVLLAFGCLYVFGMIVFVELITQKNLSALFEYLLTVVVSIPMIAGGLFFSGVFVAVLPATSFEIAKVPWIAKSGRVYRIDRLSFSCSSFLIRLVIGLALMLICPASMLLWASEGFRAVTHILAPNWQIITAHLAGFLALDFAGLFLFIRYSFFRWMTLGFVLGTFGILIWFFTTSP